MVWLKSLFTLALVLLVIYCAALTALYVFQRNVLYYPGHTYVSPQAAHADQALKEFTVKTADGIDLTGWYAPAKSEPYTIVFFHGNADNLRSVAEIARPYIALGYGMLLAEYRGYSGLPGSPTESGLYEDARAYMKALIASDVPEKDIVLFAHSLGTGVAVQMANEYHVGGVMLMSPYMSMAEVAQLHYPIFPAALLTKDRYESFRKIGGIKCPLLIGHGERDNVIPFSQGRGLFDLAHEPKEFYSSPMAGHNNLWGSGFFDVSVKWLAQLAERPASAD